MTRDSRTLGISLIEVIVVLVVVAVILLIVLMRLPRQNETARYTRCQWNLMQIGRALQFYDQLAGQLPSVPLLGTDASRHSSPLRSLLDRLGVADFTKLKASGELPEGELRTKAKEGPIAGFICASDSNARAGFANAPISYRASTGDSAEGLHGPFAPGTTSRLSIIEAGDGTSFTAGFSERLLGNAEETEALENYAEVAKPVSAGGCDQVEPKSWRGDAGVSWLASDWRSTLYHHGLPPNARPSCIASDQLTANMGASSAHVDGVNVLLLDGSVTSYRPSVDAEVWKRLAVPEPKGGTPATPSVP